MTMWSDNKIMLLWYVVPLYNSFIRILLFWNLQQTDVSKGAAKPEHSVCQEKFLL